MAIEHAFRVHVLRDDEALQTPAADVSFAAPSRAQGAHAAAQCISATGELLTLQRESTWDLVVRRHAACVWQLAERAAKVMALDYVRIDVFLSPSKPSACKINEISLSSAMELLHAAEYVGLLWLEPHLRQSYAVLGTDEPVYMLNGSASTAAHPPALAQLSMQRPGSWYWWCGPCPGQAHRAWHQEQQCDRIPDCARDRKSTPCASKRGCTFAGTTQPSPFVHHSTTAKLTPTQAEALEARLRVSLRSRLAPARVVK